MTVIRPMTRTDFAARLEHYAAQVREIRGVGRNGPHDFVEDKSEIISAMMAEARELRIVAVPVAAIVSVGTIAPGRRLIGAREIRVERRARRA